MKNPKMLLLTVVTGAIILTLIPSFICILYAPTMVGKIGGCILSMFAVLHPLIEKAIF